METNRNQKEYSKSELYLGNLAIAIWVLLGAAACALYIPLVALGFLALAAFLIFYELGKHGCVTCYYCKNCTIGMGKLPDLFFRKAGIANVNKRALSLFPFVYLLLSVVPLLLTSISLFQQVTIYKVALMLGLFFFSALTGITRWRLIVGQNNLKSKT
jgi:hypothetical protein